MARFGDSSKTSEGERKASAAELLASIIEELRAGSVEPERVRELARAAAILLGGLPPPQELVEGLIRCGLTVSEIIGVLGPLPEQGTEEGTSAEAASIEQLTCVPGLLGELIEWNVRTARYPSRVMALWRSCTGKTGSAACATSFVRSVGASSGAQISRWRSRIWRKRNG